MSQSTLPDQTAKAFKKVALIDGAGASMDVGLYLEDQASGEIAPIPWPPNWPEAVSEQWLTEHGWEVRHA